MLTRLLPIVALCASALTLVSCENTVRTPVVATISALPFFPAERIRRPFYYDVRDASVIASDTIPLDLVKDVDRKVSAAISATRRRGVEERVVLTVKIESYRPVQPFGDRRAMARFKVTAADVASGNPIAVGGFTVHSNTDNPTIAVHALAEEIAARIRFSFALQTPSIGRTARAYPPAPALERRSPVTGRVIRPGDAESDAGLVRPPRPKPVPVRQLPPGTNLEDGANGSVKLTPTPSKPKSTGLCQENDPTCTP